MKIEEMKPSEFDAKYAKHQKKQNKKSDKSIPDKKLIDDIPESEKWRLIKESGVLDNFAKSKAASEQVPDFSMPPPDDFVFDAVFYTIPFTSLYVLMDNLVLKQYNEEATKSYTAWTFARMFPALLVLIYLTNRYRHNRYSKMAMFLAGIACGLKLMTLMQGKPVLIDMKKAPGLATLWIYSVFQLDFLPCLISVLIPGLFYFFQAPSY